MNKLKRIFTKPKTTVQRQYETLRALIVDDIPASAVAKKYGYAINTIYSLVHELKSGSLSFFQDTKHGPKERQTPENIQKFVINYRSENLSVKDICSRLLNLGHKCSKSTVERILADANLPKLKRRTFLERGKTLKSAVIPERSTPLDFNTLKPFRYDTPVVGIFFFLPYILESGIIKILKNCGLPKSSAINAEQACLSMLLLKLIGNKRLSHMASYDHEQGLGVFPGLNCLPKATYMSTYSCRTSETTLQKFQVELTKLFQKKYPEFYQSSFINLDFHSIPHFGDESQMEKVWCGTRGKAIKGANTLFAQDGSSNAIAYTCADILRKNEAQEIIKFVEFWKSIRNEVKETLVFDCKLTSYQVLDKLSTEGIQFITLRKRTKKLIELTEKLPNEEWKKLYIPIPKRKHKACLIHVSEITLPNCTMPIRQIIVTKHGRSQPTYIITNNFDLSLKEVLMVYAKRWHIEQKFAELVAFFNLNALSSPLMIRIHFDILWTVIADTLYRVFAQDLPRFEHERANTLFRRFINMPGQVIYDGKEFVVKIRKRAHTPVLLGVDRLQEKIIVPWLDKRSLKIEWTA